MARTGVDTRDDYHRGVRMVPYDIVKELTIALGAVLALVLGLSFVFSSPDVPPLTVRAWATADPVDFLTTAAGELSGSTVSASYGPPYNTAGSGQSWSALAPVQWAGVHQPVDSAQEFVLGPLATASASDGRLAAALQTFRSASGQRQSAWLEAYTKALASAKVGSSNQVEVPGGAYGPLPEMSGRLLQLAQSGALDGQLLDAGHFYNTDYTRALLFMGDGSYLSALAGQQHLLGDQWGMMNETGSYPGQSWLWLYTFWYQVWPFNSDNGFLGLNASNADLGVVLLMGLLTLLLALVPFIPILRDIPRWVPVHRLIWRGAGSAGSSARQPERLAPAPPRGA